MSRLSLIQMVRATRASGHQFCATDFNNRVYSYLCFPKMTVILSGTTTKALWSKTEVDCYLGESQLPCSFRDSLIDVTKILVK